MFRLFLIALVASQASGQEDQILERGEKLLEEAKSAYEEAKTKSSVPGFVDAGFKLEEARIKFIVLQEIGAPEKQKIAADRLRAINQLSKLIHDGKVAVNSPPTDPVTAKPADAPAATPKPEPEAATAAPDVTKRSAVPDVAKQREAEKLVKELFKDQYAKKLPADRQALSRALFEQGVKTPEDRTAQWVLWREAQDVSVQNGDVRGALRAVEAAAGLFDVDALQMKQSALTSAAKAIKTPVEFGELASALLDLVDALIAADQYEGADKAAVQALAAAKKSGDAGLVARATTRSKVVAEAKTRFLAMKSVLQTLAKTPDDPAANNEMGQFLCFVKGTWDLGLRFLVKGSDPALKALAEKELALTGQAADQVAVADGWWDLAATEKSPLRKTQMISHAAGIYEAAVLSASGLVKAKIEKRLSEVEPTAGVSKPVDLLRLIDPKADAILGQWKLEDGVLSSNATAAGRVQIMYQPPEEYDVTMVFSRRSGIDNISMGLVTGGTQFCVSIDGFAGQGGASLIESIDGGGPLERNPSVVRGLHAQGNQPHTVVYSVRKGRISATVDGKKLLSWEGESRRLSPNPVWKVPDGRAMSLGSWGVELSVTKLILTPVTGQGKKLR
jgi:hypothetical protein